MICSWLHHPFWIVGLSTRMPVSRSFVTLIIGMVWKKAVTPLFRLNLLAPQANFDRNARFGIVMRCAAYAAV
jgi:hypothetical protein